MDSTKELSKPPQETVEVSVSYSFEDGREQVQEFVFTSDTLRKFGILEIRERFIAYITNHLDLQDVVQLLTATCMVTAEHDYFETLPPWFKGNSGTIHFDLIHMRRAKIICFPKDQHSSAVDTCDDMPY